MTKQNTTIDDYDDDDPLDENKNMSSQVPVSFFCVSHPSKKYKN